MKFKIIKRNNKIFLVRLSFRTKKGSIKMHLILGDDTDYAHKHPWEFKSFLALGAYKEIVDGKLYKHLPFTVVHRKCEERHQVLLYRFMGVKIPCLSVGKYTKKIQRWCERTNELCDFCSKLGYCADKAYWENKILQ